MQRDRCHRLTVPGVDCRISVFAPKRARQPPQFCRHAATFPRSPCPARPRALRIKRNVTATAPARNATGRQPPRFAWHKCIRNTQLLDRHSFRRFVAALRIFREGRGLRRWVSSTRHVTDDYKFVSINYLTVPTLK
jgi:hypothetical protein